MKATPTFIVMQHHVRLKQHFQLEFSLILIACLILKLNYYVFNLKVRRSTNCVISRNAKKGFLSSSVSKARIVNKLEIKTSRGAGFKPAAGPEVT